MNTEQIMNEIHKTTNLNPDNTAYMVKHIEYNLRNYGKQWLEIHESTECWFIYLMRDGKIGPERTLQLIEIKQGVTDDVCRYCGHNNGPQGEDRHGFDCGNCGSN